MLSELSLGQLMEMQEIPLLNDIEAISILAGIPVQELQNVIDVHDIEAFAEPVLSLSQQIKTLYNSDNIPKKITFGEGKGALSVNVTNNLSIEPAGAFMAARDIIADEINEHLKKYGDDDWKSNFNPSLKTCCQVLAHYFYCRVSGKKYNEYEVEEFCNEIKKLRVTEALPVAKHFFFCYPVLSKQKISFLHRVLLYLRKRPGYNHLKSLNISTP
jgi:hypothetical protein